MQLNGQSGKQLSKRSGSKLGIRQDSFKKYQIKFIQEVLPKLLIQNLKYI